MPPRGVKSPKRKRQYEHIKEGLLERGRKVTVIEDAIETLDPETGEKTLSELRALGAKFATTDQALARLRHSGR